MSSENRYTDYDPWAWLYNKSEANLACRRLMPKLEKLLLPYLPEKAQILDLCCGTGQLTQQLIARKYQVIGLDGSEKMLHYARENAPNAQFILGDARSFELTSTFDAVICTDSALNHILSFEELKSVFSNVHDALKDNGLFLFDLGLENRYRNIPINDGELKEEYAWTVGETYDLENKTGNFKITMFQSTNSNSNRNLTKIDLITGSLKRMIYNNFLRYAKPSTILKLVERDWQPSEIIFSVKPYSQMEVKSALEEVGFTPVNIYNFLGRAAAPAEAKYAYFVAQKPCSSLISLEDAKKEISVYKS
jgi:SAM-dependent methyltransferase